MRNFRYALVAILFLFITSCGDDDEPTAATTTELLTAQAWVISSGTITPELNGVSDFLQTLDDCDRDDTFKFNPDGTGMSDEGASKCDPTDPQTSEVTWSLSSDDKTLSIINDNDTDVWTITKISSSVLEISFTNDINGTVYTFNISFVPES